jgi:hypothetical protein
MWISLVFTPDPPFEEREEGREQGGGEREERREGGRERFFNFLFLKTCKTRSLSFFSNQILILLIKKR